MRKIWGGGGNKDTEGGASKHRKKNKTSKKGEGEGGGDEGLMSSSVPMIEFEEDDLSTLLQVSTVRSRLLQSFAALPGSQVDLVWNVLAHSNDKSGNYVSMRRSLLLQFLVAALRTSTAVRSPNIEAMIQLLLHQVEAIKSILSEPSISSGRQACVSACALLQLASSTLQFSKIGEAECDALWHKFIGTCENLLSICKDIIENAREQHVPSSHVVQSTTTTKTTGKAQKKGGGGEVAKMRK